MKPFELDYKDTVEQIRLCSENVENIANAAARAEIRDINIIVQMLDRKVQESDKKLEEANKKLREMQVQLKDDQTRLYGQVDRVFQVVTSESYRSLMLMCKC